MLRKENEVLMQDALAIVTHVHELIFTLGKQRRAEPAIPTLRLRDHLSSHSSRLIKSV